MSRKKAAAPDKLFLKKDETPQEVLRNALMSLSDYGCGVSVSDIEVAKQHIYQAIGMLELDQ